MGLEAVLPRSGLSGGGDKPREAPGRPAQVAACGQRRIWWVFHPCREPESQSGKGRTASRLSQTAMPVTQPRERERVPGPVALGTVRTAARGGERYCSHFTDAETEAGGGA